MNQVGDTKLFVVGGTPPAGTYAYAFTWWDNTVTVTTNGSAAKKLNIGGNPANSFQVPFTCDICDVYGNSQQLTSGVVVNNPPTVVPTPTILPNDAAFSFNAQVITRAYDLEEAGPVGFYWYSGTTPISSGATATDGSMQGTYAGTLVGLKTVYRNTLEYTVQQNTVLTCRIVDADGGTTALDYRLVGYDPDAPRFSVAVQPDSLTANASTQPSQYIGNEPVTLSVYAADTEPGSLSFLWSFYGSHGWQATDIPFFSTGTSTPVDVGVRNDVLRYVQGEATAGLRTVEVSVTNTATGKSARADVEIMLLANAAPTVSSVDPYAANTGVQLSPTSISKSAYPLIVLSGTAADTNNDLLTYRWDITQPITPSSLTLYGRNIALDISGYPNGVASLGQLQVSDRLGVEATPFVLPQLTITT